MKKSAIKVYLMIFICLWSYQIFANPQDIVFLEPNTSGTVGQYEKLELGIVIPTNIQNSINSFFGNNGYGHEYNNTYINPYDPDEISVEAIFHYIDNPTIIDQRIFGFYYRQYHYNNIIPPAPITDSTTKWIEDTINYHWRVRFAPKYTGNWNVTLIIKEGNSIIYQETTGRNFTCISTNNPGYLKVGSSKRYLRFENNQPFYPIGLNIAWPEPEKYDQNNSKFLPIEYYEHKEFIKKLASGEGNYCRIMNAPWSYSIETTLLGIYDNRQSIMWEFDDVINIAKAKNIYIDLSMDMCAYYNIMQDPNAYSYWYSWAYNVYKKNNGNGNGIENIFTPKDFFTNEAAIKQYKKRIRYMIARWGYSVNIASFEIFNEAYLLPNTSIAYGPLTKQDVLDWNQNIVEYIKTTLNHNDHLISLSMQQDNGYDWSVILRNNLVDFNTIHRYANYKRDGNMATAKDLEYHFGITNNEFNKPWLLSEMGLHWETCMEWEDIPYHNLLWGSAFNGSFGAGLDWWWMGLNYNAFVSDMSTLKEFVKDIDFDKENYRPQNNFSNEEYWQPIPYGYQNGEYIEAFTLTNNGGSNSKKAVGWTHNRTHFYYNLINPNCDTYFNQNLWNAYYSNNCGINTNLIPPDDDITTCPLNLTGMTIKIKNMFIKSNYEVIWYNTSNLQKIKSEMVLIGTEPELTINPPDMDEINYDYAYTISCKSPSGWIEKKTCPEQWNSVILNSELETDGTNLYYINSNNQICSIYKNNNLYYDAILKLNAQTASQNSGLLFNSSDNGIYYVGSNNKIYKFKFSSGNWVNSQVCSFQWNLAMLNSDMVTDGNKIFFTNTNGNVCALTTDGLHDDILNSSAPLSIGNGRGLLYNSIDQCVYYIAWSKVGNLIWKMYYNNGWQYERACTNQWNNVLTGSELKVSTSGNQVFYINTNNKLCVLYKNGLVWYDAIISNVINIKSNSHFIVFNDIIYFIGSDNNIYQTYYSSGWKTEPLLYGDCQQFASSGIVASNNSIFYTGNSDNYIHDIHFDNFKIPLTITGATTNGLNNWDVQGPDGADYAYKICLYETTNITASLCYPNTNYDSKLEIFCNNGTSTGYYNDNASGCGLKSTIRNVNLNTGCYYFVVDGNNGATGNYKLTIIKNVINKENEGEINTITNLKNGLNSNELVIYPNPASESININLTSDIDANYNVKIMNILGEPVYSKEHKFNQGENNINIDSKNLTNGIYNVVISNGDYIKMGKVIISH